MRRVRGGLICSGADCSTFCNRRSNFLWLFPNVLVSILFSVRRTLLLPPQPNKVGQAKKLLLLLRQALQTRMSMIWSEPSANSTSSPHDGLCNGSSWTSDFVRCACCGRYEDPRFRRWRACESADWALDPKVRPRALTAHEQAAIHFDSATVHTRLLVLALAWTHKLIALSVPLDD